MLTCLFTQNVIQQVNTFSDETKSCFARQPKETQRTEQAIFAYMYFKAMMDG